MSDRTIEQQMIRLGGAYERARLAQDWGTGAFIESAINDRCNEHPTLWLAPFIVRGRNVIRRHRHLEPVHV